MEIKRKLVGSKADMIEFLNEALRSVVQTDAAMEGHREDTRIKRAERKGYHDGLRFAVNALEDWDQTESSTNDNQAHEPESDPDEVVEEEPAPDPEDFDASKNHTTEVADFVEPEPGPERVQPVPRPTPGPVRHPSGSRPPSATR